MNNYRLRIQTLDGEHITSYSTMYVPRVGDGVCKTDTKVLIVKKQTMFEDGRVLLEGDWFFTEEKPH